QAREAERVRPVSDQPRPQLVGEVRGAAPHQQVAREQVVLCVVGDDATVAEEDDEIRALVQITGDMGGVEDAAVAVVDDLAQQIEQLVTSDGVQTAGGLVQQVLFRSVRQRHRDTQLHSYNGL